MNTKLITRTAAVFGAASMLTVGALGASANARTGDVSVQQRVEAKVTQTANYTATVCINDNTTGACTTVRRGQSFDRFPSYNGAEQISISVRPQGGREVFRNVRVSGTRLDVVLRGSAQRPVVQVR